MNNMTKSNMIRQGDILLERLDGKPGTKNRYWRNRDDIHFNGVWEDGPAELVEPGEDGSYVLAEGELSGHKHAVHGDKVALYRHKVVDWMGEGSDNYVGHLIIKEGKAVLRHEEHAPITLTKGVYCVRRQREYNPMESGNVDD